MSGFVIAGDEICVLLYSGILNKFKKLIDFRLTFKYDLLH
jgi:hypothetical protein